MVTILFLKELSQILVKPPCARNFGEPINFVVNADGVPRACAEPHCKEYRRGDLGASVPAITEQGTREQGTGEQGQRDKGTKGQGC